MEKNSRENIIFSLVFLRRKRSPKWCQKRIPFPQSLRVYFLLGKYHVTFQRKIVLLHRKTSCFPGKKATGKYENFRYLFKRTKVVFSCESSKKIVFYYESHKNTAFVRVKRGQKCRSFHTPFMLGKGGVFLERIAVFTVVKRKPLLCKK